MELQVDNKRDGYESSFKPSKNFHSERSLRPRFLLLRNSVGKSVISVNIIRVRMLSSDEYNFPRCVNCFVLLAITIMITFCAADGELIYEEYSGTLTSFPHDIPRNVVNIQDSCHGLRRAISFVIGIFIHQERSGVITRSQ